jgi:peptidoglycan/LPS O-acetylase OafA/YrhL
MGRGGPAPAADDSTIECRRSSGTPSQSGATRQAYSSFLEQAALSGGRLRHGPSAGGGARSGRDMPQAQPPAQARPSTGEVNLRARHTSSVKLGYVRALDGLRGLAILLVVAGHYTGKPAGAGGAGVGLFFVLSGFLITTLLLEELAETNRLDLRRFYVRRARRLFPALVVLLSVYLLVLGVQGRDGLRVVVLGGLYVGNIVQAFVHDNPVLRSSLGHLWSLAQEEQFYLVWPFVLMLARRRLALSVAILFFGLVAYRVLLIKDGASVIRLYFGPDTHSDWLVAGAMLAIVRIRGWLWIREPLPIIGFALFNWCALTSYADIRWQVLSPVFELGCVLMVAAAVSKTQMAELLSTRPLVWLGKISYSLYLWHIPVFAALGHRNPLFGLAVSLAAAALSYRYVEQPFRRRRRQLGLEPMPTRA